jgi:hypothetical protein
MLLALGKSGTAYLLDPAHLGGVGGQVAQARVCPAYGAASADGSTVYEPCQGGGMAAISVSGGQIRVRWRGPASASGSPVVGGGAVWVTDPSAGRLYELNPATGAVRYSVSLGTTLPHFASLSMSGSHAFVGTNDGVTAVAGALSGERLPGGQRPAARPPRSPPAANGVTAVVPDRAQAVPQRAAGVAEPGRDGEGRRAGDLRDLGVGPRGLSASPGARRISPPRISCWSRGKSRT